MNYFFKNTRFIYFFLDFVSEATQIAERLIATVRSKKTMIATCPTLIKHHIEACSWRLEVMSVPVRINILAQRTRGKNWASEE